MSGQKIRRPIHAMAPSGMTEGSRPKIWSNRKYSGAETETVQSVARGLPDV